MKILWLDLNSSYAHASLALPALHAQVMHDPSLEWGVVSATINENPGMTAGEVVRQAPDILAATCWLFNHEVLMHVISRVKAMLPRCVVALGGPEFLGHNEDFLRTNRFVDCVFRGEGEETFPQWLACWQQPKEWTRITGLCFLDAEGQYHDNGLSRVMAFDKLVNPEQSPFWWLPLPILQNTTLIVVNQQLANSCLVTQNQRGTKTGQNHGKIKSRTLRSKYPLWNTSVSFAKVQICPLKNEGKSLFLSFTTHFPTIVPQMWFLQTVLTSNSMACENRVLNFVLHSVGHFQK